MNGTISATSTATEPQETVERVYEWGECASAAKAVEGSIATVFKPMTVSHPDSPSYFSVPFRLDSDVRSEITPHVYALDTTTGFVVDLVLNVKAKSEKEYFAKLLATKKVDTTTRKHPYACFDVQDLCKAGIAQNKGSWDSHAMCRTYVFMCDGTFVDFWFSG